MTTVQTIQIGFLVFPGFPMSALSSMIEPLRAANEISGEPAFDWKLVSEHGDRVEASARVWFEPDLALDQTDGLNQLFVLSSPTARFQQPTSSEGRLRKLARHGVSMGAISGGVFPLARAGLLNGHTTSVHWCYEGAFEAEFPDLATTEDVIAIDRRLMTASGAAAAFDLSLHLIEKTLGSRVATEVACWFQHPHVRGEGIAQRKPTFNGECTQDMLPAIVRQAVEMFTSHIEDPVNIADVAAAVGVSVRQLERVFRKTTGMTPVGYYRTVRMKTARELVLYSNDTMIQIATAVGYASSSTLTQNYQDVFGIQPRKDREKINMFRVRESTSVLPA